MLRYQTRVEKLLRLPRSGFFHEWGQGYSQQIGAVKVQLLRAPQALNEWGQGYSRQTGAVKVHLLQAPQALNEWD